MPKPAVHHIHMTACADPEFLLSLTYQDEVYYSEKKDDYYVSKTKPPPNDYFKVNVLRSYSKDWKEFDAKIMERFILKPSCPEAHNIWKDFEHKFVATYNLYNYKKFFK